MTVASRRSTWHGHADRLVVGATVLITLLATISRPPAAQEAIELPAQDRLLDADFEEIYRLGAVGGGGWDTFGSVEGLGFDGAGNLYILDTQAVRISVVDPDGNLVRQFIGEGEGPGEFGSNSAGALEFAVMRDGRVAVYDPGRIGFTLFGADGGFERTIPMGGDSWRQPMFSERRLKSFEGRQPMTGDSAIQAVVQAMIDAQRAGIESMDFYPEMPVVLALRTDWEGTVWVRRRGEEGAGGDPIDLITAEGRYLGTLPRGSTVLPEAFGPNGLVAFVETDDLDVPYVVVKRFRWPEGAPE